MVTLQIHVNFNNLDTALRKKGAELDSKFSQFERDIVDIVQKWVQREAPRKTGKLKSSVKKESKAVFVSKNIAPYCDWVIDGRGPVHPINTKALRMNIGGRWIFRKSAGPAKGNPFVDRGFVSSQAEIEQRIRVFERWLEAV